MTDETPASSPANPPTPPTAPTSAAPATPPPTTQTPFDIGEEFGTAKKNLPPAKIVLIVVAVIAVVGAIIAFILRPQPAATASMDEVVAAEIPNQNSVMVAINVTIHNGSKGEYKMREVKADLDSSTGQYSDEPAAAVDFGRYMQALPALREHAIAPLNPQAIIAPGSELKGMIIVSFPVSMQDFNSRKSLKVTISAYGETVPLVLAK